MFISFSDIVNLVFPKVCAGCNKPLIKGEHEICLHCLTNLPIRLNFKTEELHQRFYGRVPLKEAHAFLFFKAKGITQALLHHIKYKGNKSLAIELGKLFGENCKEVEFYKTVDILVPVPLHKSKQRLRGYNQSEQIAIGISEALDIPVDATSVTRLIKTATQTKKNRSERWKNVDQIFGVENQSIEGKHVLIIDDVVTTGATLESCAQRILDAGAKSVSIGCLALA